jgi:hypothetical protein
LRRIVPGHALVGALLLLAQLGSRGLGSSPAEQIERSMQRPLPQAPAVPAYRSPDVWVPDRFLGDPVYGGAHSMPGHWERRLPDGTYSSPPAAVCPGVGECSSVPAGVHQFP